MKIKLKYFASIAEAVGMSGEEMELRDDTIVSNLVEALKQRFKGLKEMSNVIIAVNGAYVDPNTLLEDGDVVALFPPVSGG
jgi:molybdopterin synthase sulfur carrier subunit